MSQDDVLGRKLAALLGEVAHDDERASTRGAVAGLYRVLGESREACRWSLEAAEHCVRNGLLLRAVALAGSACLADPSNDGARRRYQELWASTGAKEAAPEPVEVSFGDLSVGKPPNWRP
jgi:hypothetical protein